MDLIVIIVISIVAVLILALSILLFVKRRRKDRERLARKGFRRTTEDFSEELKKYQARKLLDDEPDPESGRVDVATSQNFDHLVGGD